ncbi:serine hydrolase domain-containing protein [Marinimicrobium alkaliphilum]|uniref:serine hydrolase domain-containing protein n=1 Tax=Marinimicrobium alkaliphilum TaxID=2202654 RepID=UPI000DB9DEA1|nr:serine hydrolase domain-containing protein [Marinimicrobium alkaliphilum]
MAVEIQGFWPKSWQPLADTFAELFDKAGEEGAALAVYRGGEPVASLWAGEFRNDGTQKPWQENTPVNVFSAGKGLVALSVLQQVAEGRLALDRPVADDWEAFAQGGKEEITLRQLLSHRSGLSALDKRQRDATIFDWDAMLEQIARAEPWWQPGTAQGYSPFIYGWVLGELVRRSSGSEDFNSYFQREVTGLLGVEAYFGVPDSEQHRVADARPLKSGLEALVAQGSADSAALGQLMKSDPRGVTNRAFANPMSLMTATNTPEWRGAQIPAANGHMSARSLAAIYGALANKGYSEEVGVALLPPDAVELCGAELSFEHDRVLGLPLRFGHGFMLTQERADCRLGRGARAFGHPGAGGSLGFSDPDYGIGFGYVTARMGQQILVDPRAARLIDTLYSLVERH